MSIVTLRLAIVVLLLAICGLPACEQDGNGNPNGNSDCGVPLDECDAVPGCVVIDCDGCNGYAPNPQCRSDSILDEIDPCGAGCVPEACTMLDEDECVAAADAGCQVGTCTDCDGNVVFAGCYETTPPACPGAACL